MKPYGKSTDADIIDDIVQKRVEDVIEFDALSDRVTTKQVSINVERPTAKIHIGESTGAAGDAPFKLTDGTLLTTPEEGAFEFNDGHFLVSTKDDVRLAITTSNGIKTTTTTVTNTTAETILFSRVFAANELHVDEVVEILVSGVYTNASSSDDFSIRFDIDGSIIHTLSRIGGNKTDAGWEAMARFTIRSVGVSGTYIDFFRYIDDGDSPYSSGGTTEYSIDTTTSHTFTITVQWNNAKAGNSFSCTQGYVQFNH